MSTFFYGIKQGFKGMFQNKMFTLAAIGTITACLFILGVFYTLFANFRFMVYKAESNVGLTVFFDQQATDAEIKGVGEQIKDIDGVRDIKYVSADEAWEKFKSQKFEGKDDLTQAFGDKNPLQYSSSYEVYFDKVADQDKIAEEIKSLDGVRKVNGIQGAAGGLSNFNRLLAYVSITIIAMLILISVFLISSAVAMGIAVRKDEIAIMKLIGATDAFVKMPFYFEGIFMGLIGALIPIGLLRIFYGTVIGLLEKHFASIHFLSFLSVVDIFTVVIPVLIAAGVIIGLLGSILSVKKHLNI